MKKLDQDTAEDLAIDIYDLLRKRYESSGNDGIGDSLHALEMVVATIVIMFREDSRDDVLINFAKNVKYAIAKMSKFSKE